jgi:RimJ/RimL family protein N-acetyltransferase
MPFQLRETGSKPSFKWIHGEGLQNTLTGLEKFLQCQVPHKEMDRSLGLTQHWLGYDGETPVVYLLTSNVKRDEGSEYAKYGISEGPNLTLDIFIGNPNYVGKGFASAIIKEFLLTHCSDVVEVFIDPEQSNRRAVHVYQKTGFRIVGEFIASWHKVPHYVMKLHLNQISTLNAPR